VNGDNKMTRVKFVTELNGLLDVFKAGAIFVYALAISQGVDSADALTALFLIWVTADLAQTLCDRYARRAA